MKNDSEDTSSGKDLSDVMCLLQKIHDRRIFIAPDLNSKKTENAIDSYAPQITEEQIIVQVDDTVFGGAREGLIITEDALYSKELASDPVKVVFNSDTEFAIQKKTLLADGVKIFSFNMPETSEMAKLVDVLQMLAAKK